jgi:4-amino-4-deoxy-L-arabinose transferase-like glycosyltransferase
VASDAPDSLHVETPGRRHGRGVDLTLAGLALLVLLYLVTVLPSLGNDPIAGGDEGWIISASARLARDGVFGSDLFKGFYGAENHYYFNLPLHHLMLAGVFEVFGVSLGTARMVSVLFGLAALLLTYALGRRIGGAGVGLAAAALLVLLRLNLAPFSGLTLTDLGATVRYDLVSVPFGLGAALLLLRRPVPSLPQAGAAGFLVGLGALTQFIGAFVAVPLALFLLLTPAEPLRRLLLAAVFGVLFFVPWLPYFGYIAANADDFQGQSRSFVQKSDFLSPAFYLDQIEHEPDRYATSTGLERAPDGVKALFDRPSARLVMLVVGPAALFYALWRGRSDRAWLLLGLVIAGLVIELTLFESSKYFVYWVVVVPYLCAAIAGLGTAAWRWCGERPRQTTLRIAVVAVAVLFFLEGLGVAAKDVRDARNAPSYEAMGRKIEAVVPEGSVVLGDNRLWPAVQDLQLRSLLLLFYYTNPVISRDQATDIPGAFERIDAEYLLLSPLSREILAKLSPTDTQAFNEYLEGNMTKVTTIEDRAYGPIDVYQRTRR